MKSVSIIMGRHTINILASRLFNIVSAAAPRIFTAEAESAQKTILEGLRDYMNAPDQPAQTPPMPPLAPGWKYPGGEQAIQRPDKADEALKLALRAHTRLDTADKIFERHGREITFNQNSVSKMTLDVSSMSGVVQSLVQEVNKLNTTDAPTLLEELNKPAKTKRPYTKRAKFWKNRK